MCLWSTEDVLWVCHVQEWRPCFPHGQPSTEQPRSDFPNTANVSSRKRLLAPGLAGMAKCVGGVDPSSSWAADVIVCDTVSGTSPCSWLVSKPSRSPPSSSCKAGECRWVPPVSGAQHGSSTGRAVTKQHLSPSAQLSPHTGPCSSARDGGWCSRVNECLVTTHLSSI